MCKIVLYSTVSFLTSILRVGGDEVKKKVGFWPYFSVDFFVPVQRKAPHRTVLFGPVR